MASEEPSFKPKVPTLKGAENYVVWAVRIEAYLTHGGLQKAIEPNNRLTTEQNSKALSAILLFLDDGPLLNTRHLKTPYEIWSRLKELYNPEGFTTDFLVLKQLFSTNLDSYEGDIEGYLSKIRELVDDLKTKQIALPEKVIIAWTLYNLTEDYYPTVDAIVQALRASPTAYSLNSLFSILIDTSKTLEDRASGGKVLVTSLKRSKTLQDGRKEKNRCSHCNIRGHTVGQCFFKHPELRKQKVSKPSKRDQRELALLTAIRNLKGIPQTKETSKKASKKSNKALISKLQDFELTKGEDSSSDTEMVNITNGSKLSLQNSEIESSDIETNQVEVSKDTGLNTLSPPITVANNLLGNLEYSPIRLEKVIEIEDVYNTLDTKSPTNSLSKTEYLIVDSAATVNTTCKKEWLVNLKPVNKLIR
jgi:hypothetical protein